MRARKMGLFILLLTVVFVSVSIFNGKNQEDEFWKWFEKNQNDYYSEFENLDVREKKFNELSKRLKKMNENLVFEFSPLQKNKTKEFTISADGIKDSFPVVLKLVEKVCEIPDLG